MKRKKENRSYKNTAKQKITAHCPKCSTTFSVNLYWTGNGKYYEFCSDCKEFTNRYEELNEYAVCLESGNVHFSSSPEFLYSF